MIQVMCISLYYHVILSLFSLHPCPVVDVFPDYVQEFCVKSDHHCLSALLCPDFNTDYVFVLWVILFYCYLPVL